MQILQIGCPNLRQNQHFRNSMYVKCEVLGLFEGYWCEIPSTQGKILYKAGWFKDMPVNDF